MKKFITEKQVKAAYYEIFLDELDSETAAELADLSLAELEDIQENNDAECSYSDFSAGQIDAAISCYYE